MGFPYTHHDTVIIYFDEELSFDALSALKEIVGKFRRSKVHSLIGTKIIDGMAFSRIGTPKDIFGWQLYLLLLRNNPALAKAYVDFQDSDGVKLGRRFGLSEGQVYALIAWFGKKGYDLIYDTQKGFTLKGSDGRLIVPIDATRPQINLKTTTFKSIIQFSLNPYKINDPLNKRTIDLQYNKWTSLRFQSNGAEERVLCFRHNDNLVEVVGLKGEGVSGRMIANDGYKQNGLLGDKISVQFKTEGNKLLIENIKSKTLDVEVEDVLVNDTKIVTQSFTSNSPFVSDQLKVGDSLRVRVQLPNNPDAIFEFTRIEEKRVDINRIVAFGSGKINFGEIKGISVPVTISPSNVAVRCQLNPMGQIVMFGKDDPVIMRLDNAMNAEADRAMISNEEIVTIIKNLPEVDSNRVIEWLWEDASEEVIKVKLKVLRSIRRIGIDEFLDALKRIVQKTNEFLTSTGGATISYGVLFDADKHKSRRWVYELARQQGLSYQPEQLGYATESAITRMAKNGIQTILTFDDATYSGAQNYDLKREVERVYKKLGKKLPKIIIAAPFVTRKVIEQAVGGEYLYDQIMPTMDELFSEEVKKYPRDARFTGDYLEYMNSQITLTYFSFKVADSTSFVRRIGYLINQVIAPYAQKGTPFYAIEERDFHSGEISAVDFNQVDPKAQLMPKPIIEPKFESLDEMKQRLVEALKAQEHAMNQIKELSEQGEEKGGIDLTADRMNLDVESDKAQINQPLDLKELENIEINALYIKNIEIKPLNNLPELLGVSS